MKNFKHYMLGALTMSAALAFTACSSDNEAPKPAEQMGGFYLRLNLTGETTRTVEDTPTENATIEESEVKEGTLYLYKGTALKFMKKITSSDWEKQEGTSSKTNAIAVSVKNVDANTPYSVYFLANDEASSPLDGIFEATTPFADKYAADKGFVMFNQNDYSCQADQYKVTFTEANKSKDNPAKIEGDKPIKIERVVARIDAPKVSTEKISDSETSQVEAKTKVEKLELVKYALSNLPKQTNIMQKWNGNDFTMTSLTKGYFQKTSDFGDELENKGNDFFKTTAEAPKNYVFENKALTSGDDYTAMYMQFKVTLNSAAGTETEKDFEDGTFYRYDNKIYVSLNQIMKSIGGTNPFGEGQDVAKLLSELKINEAKECTASESDLADFRRNYKVEVFHKGLCYYNVPVEYQNPKFDDYYTTLRNTIYQLTVKNIFNIGADVPNGKPDEVKPNYYIQVEVSVNPWVLKTYDVDLQ